MTDRPRYIVRPVRVPGRYYSDYQVYDLVAHVFVGRPYRKRRLADKSADSRNAEVLKQADAYIKAKDNG